jgi:two-component system KDP operon response regulator KdpE
MTHILLIDDEPQFLWALRVGLERGGFRVSTASTGEEGLDLVLSGLPDLIVLDLALPGMDGFQICRQLREWSRIPTIILSVRDDGADKVRALNMGADDYLTKPFKLDELVARIHAILRRVNAGPSEDAAAVEVGDLRIDFSRRLVTVSGKEVHLTPTEYEILRVMARSGGRVVTHQHLFERVWGNSAAESPGSFRVHITRLRNKIEADPTKPRYIRTETRVGYRFWSS